MFIHREKAHASFIEFNAKSLNKSNLWFRNCLPEKNSVKKCPHLNRKYSLKDFTNNEMYYAFYIRDKFYQTDSSPLEKTRRRLIYLFPAVLSYVTPNFFLRSDIREYSILKSSHHYLLIITHPRYILSSPLPTEIRASHTELSAEDLNKSNSRLRNCFAEKNSGKNALI